MTGILYILALGLLMISAFKSKAKTKKALKMALKSFLKIAPLLVLILMVVSIVLYFIPDHVIVKYLGENNLFFGFMIATIIGSISLIPGFITFPLCGLLLQQGVSYLVLAAFTTTLMMVGLLTFPLEQEYFGTRIAVIRNIASFMIAIIVSLAIGIIYGEVL